MINSSAVKIVMMMMMMMITKTFKAMMKEDELKLNSFII